MLTAIFGNRTAALILLYLEQHGVAHATELSRHFEIPLNMVQKQLERFHKGDLLTSTCAGKRKLYAWNTKNPYVADLRRLLRRDLVERDPADGTFLTPKERLQTAESLTKEAEIIVQGGRYRPFTKTFDSLSDYEVWRKKQTNPWLI